MVLRLIKVTLFWGMLLVWTPIPAEVGSHPLHPMTPYYHHYGPQQNPPSGEVIFMPSESYSIPNFQFQDRMDKIPEAEKQPASLRPSTFTFPLPPPELMPIFKPVMPYNPQSSNRIARTAVSEHFLQIEGTHPQIFGNFPHDEIPGMFSLLPPFIMPDDTGLPAQTPPQPQFPQPQAISYQLPIVNNEYQTHFQHQPHSAPPQFINWQVQPLSPGLETGIMHAQQGQPQYWSIPPQQQDYVIQYQQQPSPHLLPITQQVTPTIPLSSLIPAPTPPQLQMQIESASAPIPTLTTTTQIPDTESKPELMSTTTPSPGSTTRIMTNSLYPEAADESPYGSLYAVSYGDYSKGTIDIEKLPLPKDGDNVKFKSGTGVDSKEEDHLKVVAMHTEPDDRNVYSPASESKLGVVHVKSGEVTWTSPECTTFTLKYEANENGYHPSIQESTATFNDCVKYGKNFDNFKKHEMFLTNVLDYVAGLVPRIIL